MKKLLLSLVATLPIFLFSQSCPDVNALAVVSDNGNENDTITVCYGETVYLKDAGSTQSMMVALTNFRFFYNGNQLGALSSQNDSVPYTVNTNGIVEIKYYVTDADGCESAPYSLFIISHQPEVDFGTYYSSCAGDSLHLSFDPPTQNESYEFSRIETNMLGCMNDNGTQTFDLVVSGVSPGTITDASDIDFIRIAMEHNRVGELEISVQCPNAQSVTLMSAGTGQFEDFGDPVWGNGAPAVDCNDISTVGEHYNYDFDEDAFQTVDQWIQNNNGNIPEGRYEPDNSYFSLIGCPINGTWTLTIVDAVPDNDGSIGNWGIDFNTDNVTLAPGTIDFTYDANASDSYWSTTDNFSYMSADMDTLIYANAMAGTNNYTYHLINNQLCEYTFDVEYELFNAPVVSAGSDGTFCEGTSLNGIVTTVATDCQVVVEMYDDFGDGWNGNSLLIDWGSGSQTVAGTGSYSSESIGIPNGSSITVTFDDSGNWDEECAFYIILGTDTLHSDGLGGAVPSTNSVPLQISCTGNNIYWTPNDGTLSDVNVLNPEVLALGTHEYVLHYEDMLNPSCNVTDTVEVIINENPEIQDTVFSGCFGNFTTVDPNPTGGMAPYTENWYGEDPMNLTTGQYLYTVTDANGCSETKLIDINFSDSMYFSNVQVTDANCYGEASGTIYFLFNGGVSPITFDWGGVNFNQIPAGTHELIATDSIGCKDTLFYTVNEPAELIVSGIVTDVQTQNDGEIDLTVSGGSGSTYSFSWNNGETTEDITGLPGGEFIVTVTDSLGCTEVDTFTVVDPFLTVNEFGNETFVAYPNPTEGLLNIQFSKTYQDLNIELFDLKGVLIERRVISGINKVQMNLHSLSPGTYVVRLRNDDLDQVFKIEKQ